MATVMFSIVLIRSGMGLRRFFFPSLKIAVKVWGLIHMIVRSGADGGRGLMYISVAV